VVDVVREYKGLVSLRRDWETAKVEVMVKAVCEKLKQYSYLRDKLLEQPKDTLYIEYSPKDRVWGFHAGMRRNLLGKIITIIVYMLRVSKSLTLLTQIFSKNLQTYNIIRLYM
jgi:predicted NAD-dependent protein-ADP-ribosyltransferase YbiA (DUF1768 family)